MKNCPECNSQKIIKDAKAIDRGDYNAANIMRLAVDEEPDALVFKRRNYSDITAEVCADCGYVAFYAADPQTLWEAYQNQRNDV